MRDKRWVRKHRGGTLTLKQHKQLMEWSIECVNHLLISLNNNPNEKIEEAIAIGTKWIDEKVTTGDAIKTSREILKYIRTLDNELEIAITRAAGHAVATAHMADHSIGPVYYGIKAMKIANKSIDVELKWQTDHIPHELKELVLESLINKKIIN